MRKLLIAAGALIVLLLAAAVLLPMLVDADAYRPRLEAAVEGATGRETTVGRLSFALLPTPSLRADGVILGEDPAFGSEPFLEAGGLAVKVSVLPLLGGRLELGAVTIDSPSVRILRQPSGWNLSSLLEPPQAGGGAPSQAAPEEGTAGDAGEGAISIREIRLTGGSLVLVDATREEPLELRAAGMQATLTDLSAAEPMGVDLSLSLGGASRVAVQGAVGPAPGPGGEPGLPVRGRITVEGLGSGEAAPWLEAFTGLVARKGSLDLDLRLEGRPPARLSAGGTISLSGLELDPLAGDGGPVALEAALDLDGELEGATVRLRKGDLRAGGARASITGEIGRIWTEPSLSLKLRSEETPVEGILPLLSLMGPLVPEGLGDTGTVRLDATLEGGLDSPGLQGRAQVKGLTFRDPSLSEPLEDLSGTVVLEADGAAVEGFQASLGKSRLEGSCWIRGFESPVITLDLNAPMLDVDELLALLVPARAAGAGGPAPAPAGATAAQGPAPQPSPLTRIVLKGKVAAERARLMNLSLSNLSAGLDLSQGRARVADARISLYGGTFQGSLTAELARKGPPFTISASLAGVDFNALATDFSPDLAGLLYGTLDAGLSLQGRGLSRSDFKEALSGEAEFSLADGRLTSVGVLKDLAAALESAGGRGIGAEETPFSFLGGTFRVKGGRVKTEDLRLDSPEISMKGEGHLTLDLNLDLDLTARISPEVSSEMIAQRENLRFLRDKKDRIRLDMRLQGTLMEPAVGVDPEMIRRVLKSAAREKLKEGGLKNLLKKKDDGG